MLVGGWKRRLYTLTMCDMACSDVPGLAQLRAVLSTDLLMYMAHIYGCGHLKMKSKSVFLCLALSYTSLARDLDLPCNVYSCPPFAHTLPARRAATHPM